jgi:diaminohydroxyphosphoribosylaminopyrimidine deaminase/5-amino-6-(5-phosphoribosylamino)uracil reductase
LLRVILDSRGSLAAESRIVKTTDNDLLVFTSNVHRNRQIAGPLRKGGVEVVVVRAKEKRIDLDCVLEELGRREITSVLLEAGHTLNGAALTAGIVDKLFLFYAPKISGDNRVPFAVAPNLKLAQLQNVRTHQFGPDFAIEAYLRDVYKK